jgi:hypothetical protein
MAADNHTTIAGNLLEGRPSSSPVVGSRPSNMASHQR